MLMRLSPGYSAGVWAPDAANLCLPRRSVRQRSRSFFSGAWTQHEENWQSAEADHDLTDRLIAEGVEADFLLFAEGGLPEATARWGERVAVGKLGVADAENPDRAPRLVLDSTTVDGKYSYTRNFSKFL